MTPTTNSPKGGHFRLFRDCFFFVCHFVQNAFLRHMNTFVPPPPLFPVAYERKLRTYTYYSTINCTGSKA